MDFKQPKSKQTSAFDHADLALAAKARVASRSCWRLSFRSSPAFTKAFNSARRTLPCADGPLDQNHSSLKTTETHLNRVGKANGSLIQNIHDYSCSDDPSGHNHIM